MTISEALTEVSNAYVPGVAKYFDQFKPDPWMQAHEDLEKVVLLKDKSLNTVAAVKFVDTCKELIARFKREAPKPKGISLADAFNSGSITNFENMASCRDQRCAHCQRKENLKIAPVANDPGRVQIICGACK